MVLKICFIFLMKIQNQFYLKKKKYLCVCVCENLAINNYLPIFVHIMLYYDISELI